MGLLAQILTIRPITCDRLCSIYLCIQVSNSWGHLIHKMGRDSETLLAFHFISGPQKENERSRSVGLMTAIDSLLYFWSQKMESVGSSWVIQPLEIFQTSGPTITTLPRNTVWKSWEKNPSKKPPSAASAPYASFAASGSSAASCSSTTTENTAWIR